MSNPKGVVLHPLQIKSLLGGGKCFLLDIEEDMFKKLYKQNPSCLYEKALMNHSPLQVGDSFFVQEEFANSYKGVYTNQFSLMLYLDSKMANPNQYEWQPASEMTFEQSRLTGTIKSVEVKKIQDFHLGDAAAIKNYPTARENTVFLETEIVEYVNSIFGKDAYEQNKNYLLVEVD